MPFGQVVSTSSRLPLQSSHHCSKSHHPRERALPRHCRHHCTKGAITSPTATSLAIAVLVVNTDQTTAESEYFAKGDENRVMYLAQWWADEARHQHCASKGAESNGYSQLKIFHNFKILVVSLREVVRLRRVVSLREVVCASRRLPLHSSQYPRKACITSLKERHYFPQGHYFAQERPYPSQD